MLIVYPIMNFIIVILQKRYIVGFTKRYARYLRKYFKLTLCPPNDHKMQMDQFHSNNGYYDIPEPPGV